MSYASSTNFNNSTKVSKTKRITRCTSGIPDQILSSVFKQIKITPKVPLTPSILSIKELDNKKKLFLEMMGYPKGKSGKKLSPLLDVEAKTPTISLVDFMGNSKYSFLKKTGFIDIYEQCRKLKELEKIAKSKNVLSSNNIKHIDQIREHAIRNPNLVRYNEVLPLFRKSKYGKKQSKDRIDRIQGIINKCDQLFVESRKKVGKVGVETGVVEVKKKVKKLSEVDKISIQTEMERIRF